MLAIEAPISHASTNLLAILTTIDHTPNRPSVGAIFFHHFSSRATPLFAVHGSQKLFGWFGGYGLAGTGGFFEGLGFRPGRLFAAATGLAEFVGGVLLALGLFEPAAAAVILSLMVVGIATVHWRNGLLAATTGVEVPLLYAAAALSLALTGPGEYSMDAKFGLSAWWNPQLTAIVLAAGVVGGLASLALRRPAPPAAPALGQP